jgi:hypothetical protein
LFAAGAVGEFALVAPGGGVSSALLASFEQAELPARAASNVHTERIVLSFAKLVICYLFMGSSAAPIQARVAPCQLGPVDARVSG